MRVQIPPSAHKKGKIIMFKHILLYFLILNIFYASNCDEIESLFESKNIDAAYALLMNNFMETQKAEFETESCNLLAYKISISLDDLDLANKYIESAIKIKDDLTTRQEAEKLTNTIREYKSAKYTLDNGNPDDAINEFEEKINSSHLLPVALFHNGLATAYKKKHNFKDYNVVNNESYFYNLDKSVKYFNDANNINPYKNYKNEILNIGKLLTKLGKERMNEDDYDSALILFNKAIDYYPEYKTSFFYKGMLYMKLQDYELALESFQEGLGNKIKNGNYKILYLTGQALERLGDFEKSLKFYNYSFNQKKSYTKAQFAIANILYKQQNFKASESELLSIISSQSDYIKAYELIVNLYIDTKRNDDAKIYAEMGLDINSKSYYLLCQLAYLYNDLNNYDTAITFSNKSLQYKPNYGPALIELGRAYTFTCKSVAAMDAFKRAKRYDRRMASDLEKWSKDHIDSACK